MGNHNHHTQQFSAGHEIGSLHENERPLHHRTAGLMLGNIAVGEYSPAHQHPSLRTISQEEVLLQEALQAKLLEQDRTDILEAAEVSQGELQMSFTKQPDQPETNFALYVDRDGIPHNN